jgi:hypothetical protein
VKLATWKQRHPDCSGRKHKDGRCADCRDRWARVRARKHPERERERAQRRRAENPALLREQGREWRRKNPERAREQDRKYRAENLERMRERQREYMRKWRTENRTRARERARSSVRKRRARKRGATVCDLTAGARAQLFADHPLCHYCGAPATTEDHIIPLKCGGWHTVANIIPACVRCNSSKNAALIENFDLRRPFYICPCISGEKFQSDGRRDTETCNI